MIGPVVAFASAVGAVGAAVTGMWGAFWACLLSTLVAAWWWERDSRRH